MREILHKFHVSCEYLLQLGHVFCDFTSLTRWNRYDGSLGFNMYKKDHGLVHRIEVDEPITHSVLVGNMRQWYHN